MIGAFCFCIDLLGGMLLKTWRNIAKKYANVRFLLDAILTESCFMHIIMNMFTHYGVTYSARKGGGKQMGRTRWQDLFFAVAMIVFFGLLFTGGSRLIASPETAALEFSIADHFEASLSCPPDHAGQSFLLNGQEGKNIAYSYVHDVAHHEPSCSPLITDANGNVVMHCSYMHAAYQTFALGDGFV